MPKTKFQSVIFTLIMVSFMVYGMVVYNIALATGTVNVGTFLSAVRELPIMIPIAFAVEFLFVGKIAKKMAFSIMSPAKYPELIKYMISICTCAIMCPAMSLAATILFMDPALGAWFKAWAMNLPMALLYQLLYCGPLVRFIFKKLFPDKQEKQHGLHVANTSVH